MTSAARPQLRAVFFDLDGTLLDTAPDMVSALDELRREHLLQPVNYRQARAHVSNGAIGLLRVGFEHLDDDGREALRERYLQFYAARLAERTRLFAGMADVLAHLESRGIAWGVVTNKPGFLTEPLLQALDLADRCVCIVSGDTLPRRKPHPDPLLHAAAAAGIACSAAAYIGDAQRDIEAGRAAGMVTVAATYGYVQPDDDPVDWAADHMVASPLELLTLLP